MLMAEGHRIQGFQISGIWMDVGRPHDLLGANLAVASAEYGDAFWDVGGSEIEGPFYMGAGSSVAGSGLKDSVVLAGSSVSGSRLDRVLVMRNCTMEDCDLAFEYSSCDVELKGTLKSIKNPSSGTIIIDEPTEVIIGDNVYPVNGKVIVRN